MRRPIDDRRPAWSGDGESIAFHRSTNVSDDLWVASAFGTTSPRMLAEDVLAGTGWLDEEVLFTDVGGLWAIGADGTGRRLVAQDVDAFDTRH